MSESLEERIDKMQESKNKEIWNELKKSDNVYVTIPTIDTIDYIYDIRKSYFKLRPLSSLKYAREYYAHVQELYNKYDFILNRGFFESNISCVGYSSIFLMNYYYSTIFFGIFIHYFWTFIW